MWIPPVLHRFWRSTGRWNVFVQVQGKSRDDNLYPLGESRDGKVNERESGKPTGADND